MLGRPRRGDVSVRGGNGTCGGARQVDEEKIEEARKRCGENWQDQRSTWNPEGLFSEGKAGDDLGEPDDRESACSCTAVE